MGEVEPVSAGIRRVGAQVRAEHHTAGVVRTLPGAVNQLDCACGVTLTNGPGWSLDEHLRLHRAEVKYEALLAVAHPDMPLIRRSPRSRGATAIDALLGGHTDVAANALAFADSGERDSLRAAAQALLGLLDVEWTAGFPSLGRYGAPDTEARVRDQVAGWNAKVAAGHESVPAAVCQRRSGGAWEPAS
ncbi:hypothetical protein [Pengzhenrongella frigida]|uniref:hypothetical protein n=1 Tax=Pengzhenrongella frigida TaxID=1259133 RepID=UPI001F5D4B4D|nr:hypothetical protein [Cellulomonas sp. HLT2-17]